MLNKKKIASVFLLLFLLVLAFSGGLYYGKNQVLCQICPPSDVDMSLFWETWNNLENKFVDKGKLDAPKMIYGAISGMVESLGDPYTVFFPPEETKIFKEDVKGSFGGVGMEIGIRDNQLQVVSPLEGTPAQKAGLRAGDKILKIGDESTEGFTSDQAVNLIRGEKGTEVVLTISRDEWKEPKEFRIIRDIIQIPSLKLEFIDLPSGGQVAHLTLYQFSEKANYDFNQAAVDILNSNVKKIILDLRNNPGGYLEVAQSIAGWMLEKGETVVIEDFGNEALTQTYKAEGPSKLAGYPVIILINQGSASASEILAGALKDNRSVKLIGEKSFGKGSVQELVDLRGDSSIKITVAKWLTPKGVSISDVGLEPDVKVEMTEQDYEQDKDPQLQKAMEIIKDL